MGVRGYMVVQRLRHTRPAHGGEDLRNTLMLTDFSSLVYLRSSSSSLSHKIRTAPLMASTESARAQRPLRRYNHRPMLRRDPALERERECDVDAAAVEA